MFEDAGHIHFVGDAPAAYLRDLNFFTRRVLAEEGRWQNAWKTKDAASGDNGGFAKLTSGELGVLIHSRARSMNSRRVPS